MQLTDDIEFGLLMQGIRQESLIDIIVGHIPDGLDSDTMRAHDAVVTALVRMRRAPKGGRLALADQVDQPANGRDSLTVWLPPSAVAQSRTFQKGAAQMSL